MWEVSQTGEDSIFATGGRLISIYPVERTTHDGPRGSINDTEIKRVTKAYETRVLDRFYLRILNN